MDKRGEIYIFTAILLCLAIYGVMKISNRLETPVEDNFDFYVENFRGERAYVVDLGYLGIDEGNVRNLLDAFIKFGWGVGIIYVSYEDGIWTVDNFLDRDIEVIGDEQGRQMLASAGENVVNLKFDLGKDFMIASSSLSDLGDKSFRGSFEGNEINIQVEDNIYNFKYSGEKKIETIVFKNIDKDYVRVVRL